MLSLQRINEKAKKLKFELQAICYAYYHPRVGILPKLIIIVALGYALSPIDLIPDFIPVIGLLDDIIIVPALIALSLKLIPEEVMRECRQRAEEEPVDFKKNWIAAIIIVIIWILLLYFLMHYAMGF
ncbi:MAG TPA: YkvA family protein [Candidatus Wallbacteria bacterium]|nr:YkvA family protein [Candidatus Wallbacteria bacterium]